ncbi:MAG: hypothetical protein JSR99_03555 [Proteobacteria bacterium]|nr:hypothetical protein [Pseudomonadota bacterium]
MTPDAPPDDFFTEQGREAYRRWQQGQEREDAFARSAHSKLIIENGDPECEKVIAALEQGWSEER